MDDTSVTDSAGNYCSWYVDNISSCGLFDDNDFTGAVACCACVIGQGISDTSSIMEVKETEILIYTDTSFQVYDIVRYIRSCVYDSSGS